MIILIDYDNLGKLKEMRLSNIIEKLLNKTPIISSNEQVSSCRLYGGWLFKGTKLTKLAAKLSAQIQRDFPKGIHVSGQKLYFKRPELATSLLCDSGNNFPNTFRIRSLPPQVKVKGFPLEGCMQPENCALDRITSFWRNKDCALDSCSVTPDDMFYRAEQKLVDSMIVTDLAYLATFTKEHVVLVSGDDDMWPGIRYSLINNVNITHIIPDSKRRSTHPYKHLCTNLYSLKRL